MKAIVNSRIIVNDNVLENMSLIYDSRIVDIVKSDSIKAADYDEIIDAKGSYLSPGFIDVHTHGCASYDTMDEAEDNIDQISRHLAAAGVTSYLPTTMTMSIREIEGALLKIRKSMSQSGGAQVLGCHLEGPFISKAYKGCHDENRIIVPDAEFISKYRDVVKVVTLAPELEGSIEFIKFCRENGVVVSIGHTAATFEEAMEAIKAGACHVTHTFNAMSPFNHRQPGTVGAAMLSDVTCELIADNIHVHPAAQQVLVKIKGVDGVILITDAMRACMMGNGTYDLGGLEVIVKGNEARLSNGTLAGSVLTLNIALKHIIENTNLNIYDAVKMITANPAKLLKLDNVKGRIEKNFDADFTLLDDNFDVNYTISRGNIIFKKEIGD